MKIIKTEISNDRTIKVFFICDDGYQVEACLLSLKKHGTVICISSQVGCIQKCAFCAAGLSAFKRRLTYEEILKQVELIIGMFPNYFKSKFQITYMGSGEPLSNYDILNSSMQYFYKEYVKLEKINISTILPELNESLLQDFKPYKNRLHIQFSLHFVDDVLRKKYFCGELPKIKKSFAFLDELALIICDKYAINYVLFDNINDSREDACKLIDLVKTSNGYLKVSEMSSIKKSKLTRSKNSSNFVKEIESSSIEYDIFESLGKDINAGCGQFYNESLI